MRFLLNYNRILNQKGAFFNCNYFGAFIKSDIIFFFKIMDVTSLTKDGIK